jgi:sugar phosphate permease
VTAADAGRHGSARWRQLGVSLVGLVLACAIQDGLAFLTVALRAEGLSPAAIGLLVSAPAAGPVLGLLTWGAAADRYGERLVLSAGLGMAAAAMTGAELAETQVATGPWLLLAGAGSASVHAAGGRLVLGWFPASQRGLAMGIDQAGQPLGVGVAASALPRLAAGGAGTAFAALAAGCAVTAVLVGVLVRDPARPERSAGGLWAATPHRSPVLWRVHGASTLLAVTRLGGAVARLGAGASSDRAGSRVGPMRLVAVAVAAVGVVPGPAAEASSRGPWAATAASR